MACRASTASDCGRLELRTIKSIPAEFKQMIRAWMSLTGSEDSEQLETLSVMMSRRIRVNEHSVDGQSHAVLDPVSAANAIFEMQIHQALQRSGYLSLRSLEILIENGLVILRGQLPSYYMKQLAQVFVLGLVGVDEVRNEVQVVLD
jgi:hypothetical protein